MSPDGKGLSPEVKTARRSSRHNGVTALSGTDLEETTMSIARWVRVAAATSLVLVGGVAGLVLAGPAGASPSVALVSSSQWGRDAAGFEHVVGQLVNNGPGVASLVQVNLNFYNSANVLLSTDFTFATVDNLNPGEKSPFEDIFTPPAGYNHYRITGISPSPFPSPPNHYFTTTVTNSFVDIIGDTHIVGTVRNNNTRTATFVEPIFTFFNGATTVASDFTFVNTDANSDVGPGQTASFEEIALTSDPAFPRFSSYSILTQSSSAPSPPPPPPPPFFTSRPGTATDISVGANGAVSVIGTNPVVGGYGIYQWAGRNWAAVTGGGVTIGVGPDGSPWVTNSAHRIYHRSGSSWIPYPGAATDIAVGANGSVWVIGTNAVTGGRGIYYWTGAGWAAVPGGAVRIAVGPDGSPWVVNSAHGIYHRVGSGWVAYPGSATDISVGANGSVWVVGTNPVAGGYGIYHWTSGWAAVGGGAVSIAVAPNGSPWVINSAHQIYAH
jgi:hypothetical protein